MGLNSSHDDRHPPFRSLGSIRLKASVSKPLLGWNSFDCYGIFANERVLRSNLEAFDQKLKPHGYEYFVLDAGWYSHFHFEKDREFPVDKRSYKQELDGFGRCIPAPHLFPKGLRPLVDDAHRRGIKFGIHIMRGIPRQAVELNLPIKGTPYFAKDIANQEDRCPWNEVMFGVDMTKPGAQAYYDSVVEYLVNDLDVDFIKADDITPFPGEVEAVARAISKMKKAVVLSLSPGNHVSRTNLPHFQKSDMLRLSGDVWDTREDLAKCFDRWEMWQEVAIPFLWLDLDMIPFGALQVYADVAADHKDELLAGKGKKRMSQLTMGQKRTFITMRALAASPLFMGGELTMTPDEDFALITDKDILECNQNGVIGKQIYFKNYIDIRKTPKKANPNEGWLGIFNRHVVKRPITFSLNDLGFSNGEKPKLYSVWDSKEIPSTSDRFTLNIPPDDVCFIKYQ